MARIRYTELPLAPHAVEAESLHALRNKEYRNYGFLIDLKSVIGATSIIDALEKLPTNIDYRGHKAYKESSVLIQSNGTWYVQYRYEDVECPHPEGTRITNREISYVKLLAQNWFGMTYSGVDSFLCEFSKFIGVNVDGYNINDYFNSFSAYVAKNCEESLHHMRIVLRYIFNLRK